MVTLRSPIKIDSSAAEDATSPARSARKATFSSNTTTSTPGSSAVSTTPAGSTAAASSTETDPAADFKSLFGHVNSALLTPATPAPAPAPPSPTLQSVFGSNPYASNPGGMAPNGVTYSYNSSYFATRATADKLAQMYGGTVVEMNAITPYGPFQQNQMNEMIRFPNGNVINAGILASYYDHGWNQQDIDSAIQKEINTFPG